MGFSDIPQIRRGLVWCTVCGRKQKVNGGQCLRSGWPKCCGYTMTIDSPDERVDLFERGAQIVKVRVGVRRVDS